MPTHELEEQTVHKVQKQEEQDSLTLSLSQPLSQPSLSQPLSFSQLMVLNEELSQQRMSQSQPQQLQHDARTDDEDADEEAQDRVSPFQLEMDVQSEDEAPRAVAAEPVSVTAPAAHVTSALMVCVYVCMRL
jgi:hypothetical protein